MQARTRIVGAVVVAVLVLIASVPTARAVIDNPDQRKCLETVAKEGGKFVKAWMKEYSKCADKNLKLTGSCNPAVDRQPKLDKAESKLRAALDKKCGSQSPLSDLSLQVIGFPGKCNDPTPPFTNDDLEDCIFETHRDRAAALLDAEFGVNIVDPVTQLPGTPPDLGKCQKEIFKGGQKLVATIQKEISKCRNGLNKGTLSGFDPADCGDNLIETKPKEKIDKAESKLRDKIESKCTDAQVAALDICNTGGGGVTTKGDAADCIIEGHHDATDNPNPAAPADLIDVEYAQVAVCGDNITNDPLAASGQSGNYAIGYAPEECDGTDDAVCPGQCGGPASTFPCLCLDIPRLRVVEHDNGDLDNGWTGVSHDQKSIVEGSGYVLDLYDCDGTGGPDTLCTVGPSCNDPPHQACVSDANCGGLGNFCRKRPTAAGSHCQNNVQVPCEVKAQCPGATNFCRRTPASTPIGASAGGVAVCNLNLWTEDITGTHEISDGSGNLRLRRDALTYFGGGTLDQPCPVCGGFCNAPAAGSLSSVGLRQRCTADAECFGIPTIGQPGTCVTANICSWGPDADKPCRPDPPFGGDSVYFGTTSIDCRPGGADISNGGLDVLTEAAVTSTTFRAPSFLCDAPGFGGSPGTADDRECILGSDTGKPCTADSQCTGGGAGSCALRCFCPVGGSAQKPNACNNACVGGGMDALLCNADTDCPGGFCHPAHCRSATNPPRCVQGSNNGQTCSADSDCPGGVCGDFDSGDEGFCPTGPIDGLCSVHDFRGCANDAACQPPTCPYCDPGETCVFRLRQCFVNSGILREGNSTASERRTAAIFCIPGSGSSSIDNTGGFTGPGTSEQPMDLFVTP